MAEITGIAWTDSTFNPWIGCTKVGPGCDHCYAEALDKRHRWKGATHWGPGVERMRTAPSNWQKPRAWNKARLKDGKTHRVFCASLADVFDNEVPTKWRNDLFELIWETPALTWLLLTKRIGNARHMLPFTTLRNMWLGATIVNQEEADRDVPKLLATNAAVRFVSYEPALGPVDWTKFPGIDWIIVGGESTQGGRPRVFELPWAMHTIDQCRRMGTAPFVKQLGSAPQEIAYPTGTTDTESKEWMRAGWTRIEQDGKTHWRRYYKFKDRAGADPAEWPEVLRVREFPSQPST